jgi:hypothetical protein
MRISVLVVKHSTALYGIFRNGAGYADNAGLVGSGGFNRKLKGIKHAARIAVCHLDKMRKSVVVNANRKISIAPLLISQGKHGYSLQIRSGKGFELKNA